MMLNNAWGVSETSANVHQNQIDDAVAWLSEDGSGGNFFLSAGHCYNKMHEFIDDAQQLDLVLAGDKHHIRTDNPYSFDPGRPAIAYIAGSIRDHFEFNLFQVNNETGTYSPVPGANSVAEVLNTGNQDNIDTWVTNLSIEFENDNNGFFYENTATIDNKFNFPIQDARVRFIMPGGMDYRVTNAIVTQQFDGDEYRVIDVTLDVAANSISVIQVGDADLCPDDPEKTEPGLCGCGVEEGTCETSTLTVNNGTGDGDYYPYENVTITADDAPADEEFDSWVINSGTAQLEDPDSDITFLTMADTDVEVTATYIADPTISINSMELVNNLTIYPNPAHTELQFEFVLEKPSLVDIALHDLTGRTIIQHHSKVELNAGSHQQTLNVSAIMPGSYFVKVYIDDAVVCNMVVIE